MKTVILSFFSQQDKLEQKFLLGSCGGTKMLVFIAKQIATELQWPVTMVRPLSSQCLDELDWGGPRPAGIVEIQAYVPPSNIQQHLHWIPENWERLFADCELLITFHELIGYPLKHLFPKMKIITINCITAEEPWAWFGPLLEACWTSVDLIVAQSQTLLDYIQGYCASQGMLAHMRPMSCWPLAFDESRLQVPAIQPKRDIDLLFVMRASESNYTHHVEFLDALRILRKGNWAGTVAFTDPTRYLTKNNLLTWQHGPWEILADSRSQEAYVRMLYRSKAVIALVSGMHGGMSIREAIYAGACPIALRVSGYEKLLEPEWPYYAESLSPEAIAYTIQRAFKYNLWAGVEESLAKTVEANVQDETFLHAWEYQIRADILAVAQA